MRIAVIAAHNRDGAEWAQDNGLSLREVVIITPRTVDRARGRTLENVYATPYMREYEPAFVDRALRGLSPALLSRRSRDLVSPCAIAH